MKPFFPYWILSCLLLAACATPPSIDQSVLQQTDNDVLWDIQSKANRQMSKWDLKGKIGLKTGKKGGSATLKWSYSHDRQNIELYGPFGGGRIQIATRPGEAVLKDTKGTVITGQTAREVLHLKLGWHVPFDELILWSRGLPDTNSQDVEIDGSGRLERLRQDIWQLEILDYGKVDSLVLPRKLKITALPGALRIYDDKDNYLGDDLQITVILKSWRNVHTG